MNRTTEFTILAAVLAVSLEIVFKQPTFKYWPALWWLVPAQILLSYSIYRMVHGSPSLPAASVLFGTFTLTARIAASLCFRWPIGWGTWVGVGLLWIAAIFRSYRP